VQRADSACDDHLGREYGRAPGVESRAAANCRCAALVQPRRDHLGGVLVIVAVSRRARRGEQPQSYPGVVLADDSRFARQGLQLESIVSFAAEYYTGDHSLSSIAHFG